MRLVEENPNVTTPCVNLADAHLKDTRHSDASQILLGRILELHRAGHAPEEIALQVLTTEPENAAFRGARLVEIILGYARAWTKERNQ